MMIEEFYFQLQTHMFHGFAYTRQLSQCIKTKPYRSPLILVDQAVSQKVYFEEIFGKVS